MTTDEASEIWNPYSSFGCPKYLRITESDPYLQQDRLCNPLIMVTETKSNVQAFSRNHKSPQLFGTKNPSAKLTPDIVRWIRANHEGRSNLGLARRFGVHPNTICDIIKGRKWKSVV